MPTYTTNPIKITDPSFSVATAIFGDLGFLGTQTISGTKRAQIIPFTLLGLATTTTVLQKASNLSDLADAIAARGNLGAKNLWYVAGTTAPAGTVGIVDDFAFNDNGVLYEKTAAAVWTSKLDLVTQAELTAANYLTATAANLLYAPIGENAGPGLRYTYNTSTTFPATTGQILLSAATFAATTSISVHTSDRNSRDFASVLDLGVAGSRLQLTFDGAEETYAWFNVTAIATSGSTRTYTVTHIQSNGTPANGEMLLQIVTVGGGGGSGGGIRLERTFSSTTTGNPTSGTLRLASTNPQTTPATVKINDTRNVNSFLTDQGNLLDKINIGNIIQITNIASGVYHVYQVTGISTAIVATTTTSYNFTCDWLFGTAGVSSFPNNAEVAFTWLPDNSTASSLTVRTVDSSVTGSASELVLPNGTLAIASGVATYTPSSSAGNLIAGLSLQELTANTSATNNTLYLVKGAGQREITLPVTPAAQFYVEASSNGEGTFKFLCNAGQIIISPGNADAFALSGSQKGTIGILFVGNNTFLATKILGAITIAGTTAPVISGFTPTFAAAAATVTITGSNFTGATAVSFAGIAATSFSVVNATTITAVVPAGVDIGPISVTTLEGTANSSSKFSNFALYDTFTAPDGTAIIGRAPDMGGGSYYKLVTSSDNGLITANKGLQASSGTNALIANPLTGNHSIFANFQTGTIVAGQAFALYARGGTTVGSTCIIIQLTNNLVNVFSYDGTNVVSISSESFTTPASGNIKVDVSSTQITINVNSGAYTKTITNSTYNTQTAVGFACTGANYTIDNFKVA